MVAVEFLFTFAFLGDLTKAMQTPLPGEVPLPANMDLARVGLDASLKAPLLMGGVGPLDPGHTGSRGLVVSFSFMFLLFWFGVTNICWSAFSLGSSMNTLSGWVEYLYTLYTEIGG